MTSILFVVPPHITFQDFFSPEENVRQVQRKDGRFYGNLMTDMPLGALSMSAYLKKFVDVHVELIDTNVELMLLDKFEYTNFYDYFLDVFKQAGATPDIIGISSLFTPSYFNLLDAARALRTLFPNAMILGGGSVPANMYTEIFASAAGSCFDALCYGEGEKPLLGLIQAENKAAFLESHPSWITRDKIARKVDFQHDFIDNLDEIPFFDYALCDRDKYGINPAINAYASVGKGNYSYHVLTSRGCPFKCTFCASHKVHGRAMRYYSLERVREDFQRLRDELDAGTFIFQDDHFMGDKDRAYDIINMVRELGVQAVFQNGLALYALERRILEALADAGVKHLVLAVESGSERVLKEVMKKPLKLNISKRVADDCRELGIYTNTNILIGMPGETKEDMEDARAFLKTLNSNWFIILCAKPLVGSEMFDICVENNYLSDDHLGRDYKRAVVQTEDFSANYVQEMAYVMNLELNFVENSDIRLGDYETALQGIKNAVRAKHDHVFGHYYAAKCYEGLNEPEKAAEHMALAREHANSQFWRKYVDMFNLPL